MFLRNFKTPTILGLILALACGAYAADSRTKLKPGINLFSPQQDIEMGQEASKQADRELQLLNDRQANDYINSLGRQLAAHGNDTQTIIPHR